MHILVESLISWNPQLQSDIFSIFLLNFLFIIFKLNILKKKMIWKMSYFYVHVLWCGSYLMQLKKIEMKTLDGVITRYDVNGEKKSIGSKCAEIDREVSIAWWISRYIYLFVL